MNDKIRYRIKGKIYYKVGEEVGDTSLVDAIWIMENPKKEVFRLLIGKYGKRYTLYSGDGMHAKVVLKTTSISKVDK